MATGGKRFVSMEASDCNIMVRRISIRPNNVIYKEMQSNPTNQMTSIGKISKDSNSPKFPLKNF